MYPTPLTPPKKPRRSRRKPLISSLVILLVIGSYSVVTISRPFAELQPSMTRTSLDVTTPPSNLPWPSYGQGAFGLSNGKILATRGQQTPVPMASTAKIITALVILEKHPIAVGSNGPTITMTQRDVDSYNRYIAINGSVSGVYNGQRLTERQMLQLLLLPSANNIADSLALWSFGSINAYLDYANKYVVAKGLKTTTVAGDASGYLPDSTSTASDLVKLGGLAMSNPVLAEILGQKTAVVPGTGTVSNYNSLLGSNNIVGVKTGNNDQNTGLFVGAARLMINGKQTTVISALSGAPNLGRVLRDSNILLGAAPANVANTTIVKKDAVLGTYSQPDGSLVQAVAANDLNVTVVRGSSVKASVTVNPISYNVAAGQTVGQVSVPVSDFSAAQNVPIVLKQSPAKPSLSYRLLHPQLP